MTIKDEDIGITDMKDDPVFLGVYIDCRCWQEKCDGYKECIDCRNNQKALKQQILENQEKAEKYDKLLINNGNNALGISIKDNIKLQQQNKSLSEENAKLKEELSKSQTECAFLQFQEKEEIQFLESELAKYQRGNA